MVKVIFILTTYFVKPTTTIHLSTTDFYYIIITATYNFIQTSTKFDISEINRLTSITGWYHLFFSQMTSEGVTGWKGQGAIGKASFL